jgi:oligopeptidase B
VSPVLSELHGQVRQDDYVWLHEADSPDVLAHLRAERRYHDLVTAPLRPQSEVLRQEMVSRTAPIDLTVSHRLGSYSYYTRYAEGTEYGSLFRTTTTEPYGDEELLDVDALARAAGASYADVGLHEVSPDERYLAWSIDFKGDEVFALRIRDLATGTDLPEQHSRTYYGAAWSADSRHLFYTVHDAHYRPFQIWRHEVGTPVAADALVLQEDDQRFGLSVTADRSETLILITSECRDTQEVWIVPATEPSRSPVSIGGRRKGHVYTATHGGSDELIITSNSGGATEFRVLRASIAEVQARGPIDIGELPEIIPHDERVRIVAVEAFVDHRVVLTRQDGATRFRVLPIDGGLGFDIDPRSAAGTVEFGVNLVFESDVITIIEQSHVDPPTWWDVNLRTGEYQHRHSQNVPNYDPRNYLAERRWARARDGVAIPVTVVRRRTTPLDGTAACVLYGYGAYEYTYEPEFDAGLPSLLDRGVVYAHAHVRGGGEMGRAWWEAGHLRNKRNSFLDFIDVANFLAANLVDGDRIVSRGGSAGGLLVSAALALAPDRWRAVIAEVPFVDVVNSMLDPDVPLTANEWDEWGDPRENEDFEYLCTYSPYEIVPTALECLVLLTGAVHDPRVLIREPAKWVARARALAPDHCAVTGLEEPGGIGKGVLFRPELGAGSHSGASGRFAHLTEEAQTQAVILCAVGES